MTEGALVRRGVAETIASVLAISRRTIHHYIKKIREG
jgi:predicted transcriptional regulator YheO